MRKGFTLMELMIVIIIIGILATLGIVQYSKAVEKARSAEAKQFLGMIRSSCAAQQMETGTAAGCDNDFINNTAGAPSTCSNRSYFAYTSTGLTTAGGKFIATRCGSNGKSPAGDTTQNISLTVDYVNGTDLFTPSPAYK